MPRPTPQNPRVRPARRPLGRRGTLIAASAAALCLGGGLLAGCGGGPGDGYAAVGAAGGGPEGGRASGPPGDVTLVPLDGEGEEGRPGGGERSPGRSPEGPSEGSPSPGGPAAEPVGDEGRTGAGPAPAGSPGSSAGARAGSGGNGGPANVPGEGRPSPTGPGGRPSPTPQTPRPNKPGKPAEPPPPGSPGPGTPPSPAAPASLTLSAPQRAAADRRWCERVTVEFRNTGGSPARSGTVTFATHVIGALGVDWATIRTSQPLPSPIVAGSTRSETYTVCLESWRVPLGMRVETRDVSAVWE
nr:hypothetical protein [Streptomyces sp. S8]